MKKISITDIKGFKLGNAENSEKGTGCTVIICEEGAVGGVDVRGGGPATRETDLLRSENTVNAVNAVVLSGGSAFGLEAASGVMRELAENRIGFDVGDDIVVPIVCGASLYDLPIGDHKAFPDVNMGIQAVRNAYSAPFTNGNHGAGTGATVGKIKGYDRAMKSGLGTFACGDGFIEVGAIAAVNAVGDIYNGAGKIIAGLRSEDGKAIYGTIKTLKSMVHDRIRLIDDSTSFINRSEIEEALAAAARQYEEETAAKASVEAATEEEPVTEVSEDEAIVTPAEENVPEAQSEEIPAEEPVEENFEEPEAPAEEPVEEYFEEPEVPTEEPVEEFVPDTPVVEVTEDSLIRFAEASIPETVAEPVIAEEPAEEPVEEHFEEPVEEQFEEPTEKPVDEHFEEPAEEPVEERFEEPAEEPVEEPAEEPVEEHFEEPVEEQFEEPAEESVEEHFEEPVEEPVEELYEEPVEEPVALTREEMGYDITFNTTITCLITNAELTKSQANKLASILHDAYARAIKPVHSTLDGDTIFVLATGKQKVNFDAFAALATDVVQYAVIDGALSAESAYGLPAAAEMH